MKTKFKIGQLLKLDETYYILKGLTKTGYPNVVANSDKYGSTKNLKDLTNTNSQGWYNLAWQIVEPLDIKHDKYKKLIAKMHQLDRKFQTRKEILNF
jgi:hypothetical protein